MALRYLAIEVYKCVNGLNPKYLNDLFTTKKYKYDLRDDSLVYRNKVFTTNHGLKSFKDYGAKIWNILPESCKGAFSLVDPGMDQSVLVPYVFILHEMDYTCRHFTRIGLYL